jgi:hypothetical protein
MFVYLDLGFYNLEFELCGRNGREIERFVYH